MSRATCSIALVRLGPAATFETEANKTRNDPAEKATLLLSESWPHIWTNQFEIEINKIRNDPTEKATLLLSESWPFIWTKQFKMIDASSCEKGRNGNPNAQPVGFYKHRHHKKSNTPHTINTSTTTPPPLPPTQCLSKHKHNSINDRRDLRDKIQVLDRNR